MNQPYENKRSEADKLGIFSHYHSLAYHLIAQATHNPNKENGSEHASRMMKTLARKAFDNYQGMKQESPDFAGVNFYQDVDFDLAQTRTGWIKNDLFYLEAATSVLEYFLDNDIRLAGSELVDAKVNENEIAVIVDEATLPVLRDEADNTSDEKFGDLKDTHRLTHDNVQRCINGLRLCEKLIGEEVDGLKTRTAETLKAPMPVQHRDFFKYYALSCVNTLQTPEPVKPATVNMGMREKFRQNFNIVERALTHSDKPKRSLKANGHKPS